MTESEPVYRALRVPMFCPCCGRMMFGSKSNQTFYDWNCCSTCFVMFIEDRESRWTAGWRPNDEELSAMRKSLNGGG